MNLTQRRLITMFKNFVQKVFVPHFSKLDPICQHEWNKFSSMLSVEQLNFGQIQLYVDTLPTNNYERRNKSPLFNKNKKENNIQANTNSINSIGFNPNKTFGGARSKNPIFPLQSDFDELEKKDFTMNKEYSRQSRQQKIDRSQPITTQSMMPTLERLYKHFVENQQKIDKIQNGAIGQAKNYYI